MFPTILEALQHAYERRHRQVGYTMQIYSIYFKINDAFVITLLKTLLLA